MYWLDNHFKIEDTSESLQYPLSFFISTKQNLNYDFFCVLLNSNDQLIDGKHFIHYKQRQSPDHSVVLVDLTNSSALFEIDFICLPDEIVKISFGLIINDDNFFSNQNTIEHNIDIDIKKINQLLSTKAQAKSSIFLSMVKIENYWASITQSLLLPDKISEIKKILLGE